ncbi:MAG: LysR family transcriptional regulator [Polyangiaceae bacterium]|nr:LysR family transcriptional regulator [Polyangiaceae bacterium]
MPASPMDLFSGIVPFVTTAEARSFRTAAKQLGVTTSAISKAIAKLEDELGVRLLHRTARNVTLTTEGHEFFERCRSAATEIRTARDTAASARDAPGGLLRVSMPARIGRKVLALLPRLLGKHPQLSVQAILTDRFVLLSDENIDVAVRVGHFDDSRYVLAHRLRSSRWITAASRSYLASAGEPASPDALARHECLRFIMQSGRPQDWHYRVKGTQVSAPVAGRLTADDGEALVAAAIEGLGLVYAPDFMIEQELASGQLVEVLRPYALSGPALSVLCPPGRNRSANVRAFVRLMREAMRR